MGQALSRAEGAQQAAAASLFAGWQEKLIASALEGAMGGVWMLEDTPGGALAECGDFLFLEARDSQTARNLLMAWKREHAGRYAILWRATPHCQRWRLRCSRAMRRLRGAMPFTRAARPSTGNAWRALPPVRLRTWNCGRLTGRPAAWPCRRPGRGPSANSSVTRTTFGPRPGVAALRDGELVGGASSYVCFSGGIELQVETRKDMRRRGVALACCARLIS